MAPEPSARRWRKPRIRSVLLLANLALLLLPLGGLWLLRLYESALVRQTETELVSQAAVIGAAFRAAYPGAGPPLEGDWTPRPATLDLARDTVFRPPDAARPGPPAEPAARIAGAALQPVLVEAQRVTLAAMRVVDRQGVVVATSREELGLSLIDQVEIAGALEGQPISAIRARHVSPGQPAGPASLSRSGAIRVFVAQPVLEAGQVIGAVLLSRTPPDIQQTLHGKRWEVGFLVLAVLISAGGLALFTGYTVSRPIQAVTARARAVAAGQRVPEGRVRRSAVREADELSAAIQAMATTLERRADYIGAFAAEVSHEFKTPLAGLRGALELLQDHAEAMAPAERERFLAQAVADVARLDLLVRRLLELARIEAPGPHGPDSCDPGAVVAAAMRPFSAAGMDLHLDAVPTQPVAMAAEALHSVVTNLLENVRQHAGPGAACRLELRQDGNVTLLVADDGRGISTGNAGRVFDRFFTTARQDGGTGLGLTIARGRLQAAGGSIRLLPRAQGAAFELVMPVAAE